MRSWLSDLKNIFLGNDLYPKDFQVSLTDEIDLWREKIFNSGIKFVFVFSAISVVASIVSLLEQGSIIFVILESFHLISLAFIIFSKGLSTYSRKVLVAILVLIVGLNNILLLGNSGSGYFFLFIIPIYAGFFFGHTATLRTLAGILGVLLVLGVLEELKILPYSVSPNNNSDTYFVFFVDFFFLSSAISIALSHLFRKLNITVKKEEKFKNLLELEQKRLLHAKDRAEVADRLKSAFLANMSHEIRTPLNGILGFAELLKDDEIEKYDWNEYVDIIIGNGKHLLNIINDIIDISKIESQQLNIKAESFDPNELLNELFGFYENHKKTIEKEHVELILSVTNECADNHVKTDKTRLKQVLSNLIHNAIKFTEKGKIEFGFSYLENDEIEFFVEDTGIGISDDDLEIIFERFRQSDSVNRRSMHGTGLGLSICRALIEMMGGKIKVSSEVSKGSRFSFKIPLNHFSELSLNEGDNIEKEIDLNV
jgi:signal transduction histidine kinase